MSLDMSLTPGWSIKTCAYDDKVHMHHPKFAFTDMPMEDFCAMVEYVMTNTDIMPNDPRIELLQRMRLLKVVSGYNDNRHRLAYSTPKISAEDKAALRKLDKSIAEIKKMSTAKPKKANSKK